MKFTKFLLTFVAGAAAGAAVALLYAPMPGRKMQRKLGNFGEKVAEKVDDFKVAARRMAS